MRSKFFDREIDPACPVLCHWDAQCGPGLCAVPQAGGHGGGGSLLRFPVRSAAAGDPPGPPKIAAGDYRPEDFEL